MAPAFRLLRDDPSAKAPGKGRRVIRLSQGRGYGSADHFAAPANAPGPLLRGFF